MSHLIDPHGGHLCDLMAVPKDAERLRSESIEYPSLTLTPRQLCDLELLMEGGFSPLEGFLGREDYDCVLREMRLAGGIVWPIPIMLDVPLALAEQLARGGRLALRDTEGTMLAALEVQAVWEYDSEIEAEAVFGTADRSHPGVATLMAQQPVYVGGRVIGIEKIAHYDFKVLRKTPAELRAEFSAAGWRRVTAFQTRNPMHRAHRELTIRAAEKVGSNLLVNPVVGLTKPGDINHYTRVHCYQAISRHYPPGMMKLSLLNLAMRMGGPREALWHAIIRRNHGCTHLIVGRDHAGPGIDPSGRPYYGPYEAQELVARYQGEIGVQMVPFQEMVYVPAKGQYFPADEIAPEDEVESISGTMFRQRLRDGVDVPEWFSYPEVVDELRRAYPSRDRQGITLFFTGLSGSGKSTLAKILEGRLMELATRPVTLLDGDIVRRNLSSELGFSREHRDLNILRIGFVANEISKNGGIAICAPIAPYTETRYRVRELISEYGAFIEIYVATPLEVCERRDRKGLYAKARSGQIKNFTGIDDPYESPENPELVIDTSDLTPEEAAQEVWLYLEREGYLR